MKLKTKNFTKNPHIQFDLERLKDPNIAEVFQVKIGRKLTALCILYNDVDAHVNSLKELQLSTTEEVFGRRGKKSQPWVTNVVLDLCDQRQQPKQQKCTSTKTGLEYRKANRNVRKKMKAAKKEWIKEQCKNIEKGMMLGNTKEAYPQGFHQQYPTA